MKKDKLIELYEFLTKRNILFTDLIDNIKKLSDEDNNIVLKCMSPKGMILLLSSEKFKLLDNNIKNEIINNVKDIKRKKIFKYIISIVEDDNIKEKGLTSKIVKIISNSYNEYQAKYATMVAKNSFALKSAHILYLIELVKDASNEYSCKYASNVACNINVLYSENVLELTRLISKCRKKSKLEYVYNVATCASLLYSNENVLELTTIVNSALGIEQAHHASLIARNDNIRKVANIQELVRIIAYMPEEKVKYLNFYKYSSNHISYLISPLEIVEYYYAIYNNDDEIILEKLYNEIVEKINKKEEISDNSIWSDMKKNPEEIINALNSYPDNLELTEDFTLKRNQ